MSRKKDPQNMKPAHSPSAETTGASSTDSDDDMCAPNSETETIPASQPEEAGGPQDNYGEQIYLRMTQREKILTKEQLEVLIGCLHESYPHHARMILLMREIGLWLSLALALKIGDFAVPGIVRIARGWSNDGEFPVPGYERGQFQQGILSPETLPASAAAQAAVVEQIAYLKAKGFPTGPNDWLFPGRDTGHPWGPGAFYLVVLRPALRRGQLPEASPKELYFSIMRVLIKDLAATEAQASPSQIPCPACGQVITRPSPGGLAPSIGSPSCSHSERSER